MKSKELRYNLRILFLVCICSILSLSCHDASYTNAIPSESIALVSIDAKSLNKDGDIALLEMFSGKDIRKSGLDFSEKVYMFESQDGNLGLCAKIKSKSDVVSFLEEDKSNKISPLQEYRGAHFAVLNDSWMIGFNDQSFLVMGPTPASGQSILRQNMANYLKQDDEQGIGSSKLFTKLDSIDSPMAMVTQMQALPDKFIAPFTLGAPKDADASQILVAANIKVENDVLKIDGETFSFNKSINHSLKEAYKEYRPIADTFLGNMSNKDLLGLFMNVDGNKFIHHLHDNKSLAGLLLGINSAIDMDNIIRSFDGDMAIIMPSYSDDKLQLSLSAQTAHHKWIEDVAYWKKSCPVGGKILDWESRSFYYTGNELSYYFGITPSNLFFSGSTAALAKSSIQKSSSPLSSDVQIQLRGKKVGVVVNVAAIHNDNIDLVNKMLKPIVGNITTIVYTLK